MGPGKGGGEGEGEGGRVVDRPCRTSEYRVSLVHTQVVIKFLNTVSGAVSKVLESAEPSIRYTQQVYGDAHRAIISSDTYTSAVDAANEVLQRVQESSVYKASAKRLYPAISGIADPALEKLLNSAYAKALIDHLKPLPRQPGEQMLRPMCATC